jgi:hypothetical protein
MMDLLSGNGNMNSVISSSCTKITSDANTESQEMIFKTRPYTIAF